jgi:hypothetical protein
MLPSASVCTLAAMLIPSLGPPDHAGAAILCGDRQALIGHRTGGRGPRSIEALLHRQLRRDRNGFVYNTGRRKQHGSKKSDRRTHR